MKRIEFLKFAVALAVGAIASEASAAVTFSGSSTVSGSSIGISASATFSTDGHGDLIVALVNTYAGDTPDTSHVLTGLFFSGANGLTPVSAAAPSGSREWDEGNQILLEGPTTLGQQWEYLSGISGAPDNATAGISSTGLGVFGKGNFANSGVAVDGPPYGILSAGYNGSTGDGLKSQEPFIQNSMVFTLSGFNGNLDSISDIVFQYGTTAGSDFFSGNAIAPEANFGLGTAFVLLLVTGFSWLKRLGERRAGD